MQSRIGGRRAAPPRPTLLVGDLSACRAAFERLQQRVLELSLVQQATVEDAGEETIKIVEVWRDLVPRCRALRETLTSLRELSHFTREVYECAADVCCRAGDFSEALKALQTLVGLIYPALAAQAADKAATTAATAAGAGAVGQEGWQLEQRQQATPAAAGWAAGSSLTVDDDNDDGESSAWLAGSAAVVDEAALAAALADPRFRRWPEAAGALALYFACARPAGAPPGDGQLDTVATLRRLPRLLLATPHVGAALQLRAALVAGDYVAAFRLRAAAPPLVRAVSDGAAGGARERALTAMGAAYRNIAVAAVCRALALDAPRQLLACLKLLADRGHVAAGRALAGLQQEDAASLATAEVVFKG